jgi:hypothetical protein
MMTTAEWAEVARLLRALLDALPEQAGSPRDRRTRLRVEGAATALEARS